jgi:hypothetical protein
MSLHDAMKRNNAAEVSKLIGEGHDVNATNRSGLTVIQYAANTYGLNIGRAGNLTAEAQKLRGQWRQTLYPLIATNKVQIIAVTKASFDSPNLIHTPKVLDILVDSMLHELGFSVSELARARGYKCYF